MSKPEPISWWRWRFATVGVLLTLLVVASAYPVAAQEPDGQTINSWAITPTGTDPTQPGSRSHLTYSLAPGTSIDDSVTLWNYSNVPLSFDLYATDAYNTKNGSVTLLDARDKPRDAGAWTKLGLSHITLPAETSARIPVTLTVPSDATPGDHPAGIIASSKTAALQGGHQVVLDRRLGLRLFTRVKGPVEAQLEIENVESTYHGALNPLDGTLDVVYTVRNTGNVRLGAHQKVEVRDLFGSADSLRPKDIAELLPGNAITLRQHFTGVAATLRVSSEVTLTPFAPADGGFQAPPRFARSDGGWAIPWLLLVLVAALFLSAWAYARWRRGWGRRAAGRSSVVTPGAV
jgi:hypothetical protein